MMFRFQTKEEQMYLIHQDHEGNGLWAEPWIQSDDPSATPPKSKKKKKKKKVWRVNRTSPSSTSSPGTNEWTSN
jgi:hypothetical protein